MALAGLDYTGVDESSVILDEDAESGRLPVTIISDTLPELPERFRIRLTSVELVGGPPLDPGNVPTIGEFDSSSLLSSFLFQNICGYYYRNGNHQQSD